MAVNLGTTIVALKYSDGVILAADTRTSVGSYVANRVTNKITFLHDYIACCRSGSAADTQAIAEAVQTSLRQLEAREGRRPDVKRASILVKEIVYSYKEYLSASMIIAGCDSQGPSVYCVTLTGSMHKQDFALSGSGSVYVTSMLDTLYKPEMTKEESIDLARKVIECAISRDIYSGGCIRVMDIRNDSVEQFFYEATTN